MYKAYRDIALDFDTCNFHACNDYYNTAHTTQYWTKELMNSVYLHTTFTLCKTECTLRSVFPIKCSSNTIFVTYIIFKSNFFSSNHLLKQSQHVWVSLINVIYLEVGTMPMLWLHACVWKIHVQQYNYKYCTIDMSRLVNFLIAKICLGWPTQWHEGNCFFF